MSRKLDVIIAGALLAAIVFSGLAHGAVEAWSVAGLQLLLILILMLWAWRIVAQRRLRIAIPPAAFPLIGLIIFGAVQGFAWTGSDGRRASLSVDADLTRGTVFMLLLFTGAFLVAANFWTSRTRLRIFAWFLTIYGFALSVFALIQGFTWNERFYWVRPIADLMAPYGPFPSHNNYAGYIELFIPISVAMALSHAVQKPARMFCAFAATIMSLSVVFSLSRGGMISVAGGLLFLAVASLQTARARRKAWAGEQWPEEGDLDDDDDEVFDVPRWRRAPLPQVAVVVAIVGAIIAGMLWLGPDTVASRLTQGTLTGTDPQGQNFYASRGWIWSDTWRMIKANPVAGIGLGAYRTAFPNYTANDGSLQVSQAHNDFLQIMADGGVIGSILAIWFIVAVFRACAVGLKSRDPWRGLMALGAGAGIFSLLVHSLFDFNLQIPSTALLFLVLAGIMGGVSALRERSEEENKRRGSERHRHRREEALAA